jgi:Ca2+-binding RTX toxin-like protein
VPDNRLVADRDGLARLSAQLRNGADKLTDAALPASDAPDVGRSSANVGVALSAVVRSMALLVAQSQRTASKINASNGSYGDADNEIATGLRELDDELLEPN